MNITASSVVLALGLDHGQAQAVLEQHAVRQVGQDVVVGLVGDHFLGALAVGDVARHAVGAEELELLHFLRRARACRSS